VKKKLIVLLAAVSVLSMSTGAIAASTVTPIKAFLDGTLKFKVDGADWTPRDGAGKEALPITYEGTTYLPVRAVSNLFKTPIKYDGKTKTILIGEAEAIGFGSSAIQPKFKPWDFQDIIEASKLVFDGKTYSGAYSMSAWDASLPNDYMSFQFDAKYKSLHLVVTGDADLKLRVSSLNEQVLASDLTIQKGKVSTFDIDLKDSDGIMLYPYDAEAATDPLFYVLKESTVK